MAHPYSTLRTRVSCPREMTSIDQPATPQNLTPLGRTVQTWSLLQLKKRMKTPFLMTQLLRLADQFEKCLPTIQ